MKRQHPLAIIGYTSKNFWLLLIPLIRGLVALKFDFYNWASGAQWDILAVTVMIAAAYMRWYCTSYEVTDDSVHIKTGVIVRRDTDIPFKCISAVTSEENPIYGKFGAIRLYIDTDAVTGSRKQADVNIMTDRMTRAQLFNLLSAAFTEDEPKKINYTYKVSKRSLVAFSFLFSSALSGVALLITAFSGSTDIIGDQLERDFLTVVNDLSDVVASRLGRLIKGISPAGIAVSIIIGVGFLISFAENILRHINFTAGRRGKCIIISAGLIVKRMYCINSRRVNIADMRQNLLMKFFGITSVHVNCTGYGKRKNEFPVFVPICSIRRINDGKSVRKLSSVMEMLLPDFSGAESYINPGTTYIMRFIMPPALAVYGILLLGMVLMIMFPHWYSLIWFMSILLEIPAIWLVFVKACAYCTNGINITDKSVCAKYSVWYSFHTITVPLERVAEIRITQTIFQRMNRSCDVIIYTNSEYIGSHRITGLPITEVQELIRERFK